MTAVAEENVSSETVPELSSENDEDTEIFVTETEPYLFRYRHLRRSRSDQQHRHFSRSWILMHRPEEFYHSKFRLTFRTSTSELVRTSETWR